MIDPKILEEIAEEDEMEEERVTLKSQIEKLSQKIKIGFLTDKFSTKLARHFRRVRRGKEEEGPFLGVGEHPVLARSDLGEDLQQ